MGNKKFGKQQILLLIRAAFFIFYPAIFVTAFTGARMLVEEIAAKETLKLDGFVETLIILCVITILFGRIFCGFFCAFGTLGDAVYWMSSRIQKKRKKRPFHVFAKAGGVLRYGKYIVLIAVLALAAAGYGSTVSMNSPLSAFSRLHALKPVSSMIGLGLFILILIGMALEPRFFCRFCCPMGAIFSLLPVMPFSVVQRDREQCIKGCKACQMVCPASLEVPSKEEGDNAMSGECFACGKCAERCPRRNAERPFPGKYLKSK